MRAVDIQETDRNNPERVAMSSNRGHPDLSVLKNRSRRVAHQSHVLRGYPRATPSSGRFIAAIRAGLDCLAFDRLGVSGTHRDGSLFRLSANDFAKKLVSKFFVRSD